MSSPDHVPEESDRSAITIYALMAFDASEALDEILACDDSRALSTLRAMLRSEGTERTDRDLNALFLGPVERRLVALAAPGVDVSGERPPRPIPVMTTPTNYDGDPAGSPGDRREGDTRP